MRRPIETSRTAKPPKHIEEIGMSTERYFELKVHIKSIVVPGTPAFEGKRFDSKDPVYRQWLSNALVEIGPRFFPKDGRGLIWPEDCDRISRAVHQVIRALSLKIKKKYHQQAGLGGVGGGTEGNGAGVKQESGQYEGGGPDDTDVEEDAEPEADAVAIELEDLLGLMQPELFAQFPDWTDEPFDWDEVADSNTSDALRHLAGLDQ